LEANTVKKFSRRHLAGVILAVLLLITAILTAAHYNLLPQAVWRQHNNTPVDLTAVPLGLINKPVQIARMGTIESATSVPVNAEYTGRLSEVYITAGQAVKAGQPLFKMEVSSEPVAVQTRDTSPQTQATYDKALEDFNRYQKLFEMGAIPRRQLDTAAARLQQAKDSLSQPQPVQQSANAPVNGSATIVAPISGNVTNLALAAGASVQAGQQLLSLGSGQEFEVVLPLEQNDLYLVHLGAPAVVEVAGQTIAGQVTKIYPKIEANQISAFLAHVKLTTNPASLLKAGLPANVRIGTDNTAAVPAVPTAAIHQDGEGRSFIYIAANGKAVRQQIITSDTIGEFTEITSDLPQQSMIITDKLAELKDGDAITINQ
jgi:RND family efflux transporter MFP subunit